MKTNVKANTSSVSLQNLNLFNTTAAQTSLSGALKGCLGSLDGACIEKLLVHCASALECNDITLAQQVMWVLNNVASSSGDPNQRLTSWFLRALISKASQLCPNAIGFNNGNGLGVERRLMSVTELAAYVDLIPWHRFGFCASNSAIFNLVQGQSSIHILDFGIAHCMQWPTLIDALAKRSEGPPSLKISVPSIRPHVPPMVNVSVEEVGFKLRNFASSRNVPFEFNIIGEDSAILSPSNKIYYEETYRFKLGTFLNQLSSWRLNVKDDEILVVNCQNWLRYLSDESKSSNGGIALRDAFLEVLQCLRPHIVTVVDEDSNISDLSLMSRITSCFNYFWIPFDALETFLPKDSCQRMEYEADIGYKIENIIGFEGSKRLERLESGNKLSQRMKNAGFVSLPYCEETISEVKCLLDEHSSGWGMKREEDMLVLTWKGHNAVFATSWVPSSCGLDDPEFYSG